MDNDGKIYIKFGEDSELNIMKRELKNSTLTERLSFAYVSVKCFHSHGQQIYRFTGRKESIYIRK